MPTIPNHSRSSLRNKILVSYILIIFLFAIFLSLTIQGTLEPRLEKIGLGKEKIKIIVNEFTARVLGLSMVVMLFGILVSFFLAKTITQPITELLEGIQKIKEGNLSFRVNIKTGDEIEELAEQFNVMTDAVEKKEAFLQESKDILEIRVMARTRQLRELAGSLDQQVKEKTKALNQRVKELEDSRRALTNILMDVREARELAEEEKNKTLSIIQNFADGLLIFDRENKCILINPQAEDLLEIKSQEVLGRSLWELRSFPPLRPILIFFERDFKKIFREEAPLTEDRVLEVSSLPIIREGKETGYLLVLHDVSREKRIEKMKTEFVSVAAHQLRTPLSAIKWTLKMFLDGDLGKLLPEQRDFIEKTYKSNERMIGLIGDLLNVTRIEEGRYLYKPSPNNLEKILQDVLSSFKEEFQKKNLSLEFEKGEGKLPEVVVDEEKIRLAIENLIDNALRYTPEGGKVKISLKRVNMELECSVKDTGIGIPKEQQDRIFTKFFRGSNAVKAETEGSGLGLFIVKNIIEAHRGRIWFESEEGKGTTFYFRLPIKN